VRTVGADLGGTKLLLVAESPDGRVVARVPTGPSFDGRALEAALERFLGELGGQVDAVGLAVPGLVGPGPRVEACDVLPGLVGWRPPPTLAHGRLAMVNDAEAALREECHDAQPGLTAAVVMAGTGIGAALLVEGKRFGGANGWAGELGGIPIAGPYGVRKLDEIASGAALVARLEMDGVRIRERLDRGDEMAQRAVREAGEALGLGLAALIDLFNPALLAVGGGLIEMPGYLEAALAGAQAHALPELWRACRLRRVRSGDLVAALGAARAAAEAARSVSK
jgi:glucokinase